MAITFDSKIRELQEKKSNLDLSVLNSKRQEYKSMLLESLDAPMDGLQESDAITILKELKGYHENIKEIDKTIQNIPEAAKKIDAEIAFLQEKKESIKKLSLYKDTEEWLAEIFLRKSEDVKEGESPYTDEVYAYAKKTNNEDIIRKFHNRALKEEEYNEQKELMEEEKAKEMYGDLFDEADNRYESFNKHEENPTSENWEIVQEEIKDIRDSSKTEKVVEKADDELPEWMSERLKTEMWAKEYKCLDFNKMKKFLRNEKKNVWYIYIRHVKNTFKDKQTFDAAIKLIHLICEKYPEFEIFDEEQQRSTTGTPNTTKNDRLVQEAVNSWSWKMEGDSVKSKLEKLNNIANIEDTEKRCKKYVSLLKKVWCKFYDKDEFIKILEDAITTQTNVKLDSGIQSLLSKIIQANLSPEKSKKNWYLSYKLSRGFWARRIVMYPNGNIFTICSHDEYEEIISKEPPADQKK